MSNTTEFPDRNKIEEQTSEWLAAIDRGLAGDEQEKLQDWLAESPLHGETLVHFASVWDLMDLVAPVAKVLPLGERLDSVHQPVKNKEANSGSFDLVGYEPRSLVSGWLPVSGALAGLFVMVLVLAMFPEPADTTFTSVYRTEVGEQSDVMLPDGSRLELNTNTEVSVLISDSLRKVVLIRGEAYFDVAKNPEAPFVAEAGDTQVIAIGTAFNIELLNPDEIEVMVTEGKVLVDHAGSRNGLDDVDPSISRISFDDLSAHEMFLSVGEKAILVKNQEQPRVVADSFDTESDLAWREGMLIFEGESLAEAISEINRYTSLKLEIIDDSIRDIEVGGYFRAGDTDQLMVIFENNFGIMNKRKGDRLLLSRDLR